MIKVLVVDDSLFMRRLVSDMLNSDPEINVLDTAKNGAEGLEKILKSKPDVVTLDLVMPGWDGLTTLKHIMVEHPTPVLLLSAHSKKDAEITIDCLHAGAVGFVLKPSGELSLDIENVKDELIAGVKAASKVNVTRLKSLVAKKPKKQKHKLISVNKIVVMGASTGGPQTLEIILSSLPVDFPAPIIVVQHVPTLFFTESLAEHLNKVCELEVKVAENNEIIQSGKVYLAPAGSKMTINSCSSFGVRNLIRNPRVENPEPRITEHHTISLRQEKQNLCGPSIDISMKSAVEIYNDNSIGIILSGMGQDGLEGMMGIKESGGRTIVQDKSSLIFGMPKAVIEAGYADRVLPANEIPLAMEEYVS